MEYRHVAFNTLTGEILMSVTANALKRSVKLHAEDGGKWIFAHHGYESMRKKL